MKKLLVILFLPLFSFAQDVSYNIGGNNSGYFNFEKL